MSSSIFLATFCANLFPASYPPPPLPLSVLLWVPSSLQLFGRSKGAVLGLLQRKSQPAGPGFLAWGGGKVRFADHAHLLVRGVVLYRSDANSVQNRLRRVRSVRLPNWGSCQFVLFISGHGVKCLRSVHSVQSELFRPSPTPNLTQRRQGPE